MRDIIQEAIKLDLPTSIISEIEDLHEQALESIAEAIKSKEKVSVAESYDKAYALLTGVTDPTKIKVEHPGILETGGLPIDKLPLVHFKSLAAKKGRGAIVRALQNLFRWNKERNPDLSKWAGVTSDKLSEWCDANPDECPGTPR